MLTRVRMVEHVQQTEKILNVPAMWDSRGTHVNRVIVKHLYNVDASQLDCQLDQCHLMNNL